MSNWQIVLLKIAAMFLVICVGWLARHRGYLAAETMRTLSRFVIDLAFPAMVFTQLLRTVDPAALRAGWFVPLLGGAIIVAAWGIGLVTAPLLARPEQRRTFVFLVAIPNWIFLPLPIAEALYGAEGVRAVLLYNVGAQLLLWTLGVWILRGDMTVRESVRNIVTNPGLLATAAGVLVACTVPAARGWETLNAAAASGPQLAGGAIIQALAMVGSLTIPLSLMMIGAQLGGLEAYVHKPSVPLWGVLAARLLAAPLALAVVMVLAAKGGLVMPEVPRLVGCLIASMPVAITCSVFAERFGGDIALSAQAIFYSTLFSLATVPLVFALFQHLGL